MCHVVFCTLLIGSRQLNRRFIDNQSISVPLLEQSRENATQYTAGFFCFVDGRYFVLVLEIDLPIDIRYLQ